ncbi:MAG: NAD(P)-binding domain-containing protein, partial [Phycisphaerae bacterium]
MSDTELGFLGAGNMAEAIARGILRAGLLAPGAMIAADPDPARRCLFQEDLGIRAVEDNETIVEQAPVVLVAVKPQQFDKALAPVGSLFGPESLVVSICAGVSTRHIEEITATGTRVVRAMPNTPILVGRGIVAVCAGAKATEDDLAVA